MKRGAIVDFKEFVVALADDKYALAGWNHSPGCLAHAIYRQAPLRVGKEIVFLKETIDVVAAAVIADLIGRAAWIARAEAGNAPDEPADDRQPGSPWNPRGLPLLFHREMSDGRRLAMDR